MSQNKPYFFQSFLIVVISVIALIGFKQFLPAKIFTETTIVTKNIVVDSLMLEALQEEEVLNHSENDNKADTVVKPAVKKVPVQQNITFKPSEGEGIIFPPENFNNYKGLQYLIPFYQKLVQLEKTGEGNVRIAYFGDSMNDGDMIVKDLRSALQARFGGEGVGFVSITSESAASRSTLTHQYSNNWKTQSYLRIKHPDSPFGVNGHVFYTKPDTVNTVWVKFKASNYKYISSLNNPVLFYGQSANSEASVRFIAGKDTLVKKLNPVNRLNTISLKDSYKVLKADFIAADSIPVYGFNFDDGRGVHVDNFSARGNSGLPISTFNTRLMKAFNDKLGYDLVVLQYGTNVLGNGSLNYTWYEKRMARVVEHIRECFPGVAIMIVSVADKSTKYGTEMQTDSAVVPLTMAQKRYAVKSEAAYINLYHLMGGKGSMVKWVQDTVPALANKDYTHFNFRGSKKVADIIYKELNSGYEKYKKLGGGKIIKSRVRKDSVRKDTLRHRAIINHHKPDSTHVE